jgi:hypothetical protein
MQMRFDFTVLEEIVNFLLHNFVLKAMRLPMSSIFSQKKLDCGKKAAIMCGNHRYIRLKG